MKGGLDIRGQPADTRTAEQKQAMRQLLEELHGRYPRALIVGHHDLNPGKNCPCYDAAREYADLQSSHLLPLHQIIDNVLNVRC